MGDARLLQTAEAVSCFGSDELRTLIEDMRDTMQALDGVGLAATQIGVNLRVVIFGVPSASSADNVGQNPRYPDAQAVPETVLINPLITVLDEITEDAWEGCLSLPGLRGLTPRFQNIRYQGYDEQGVSINRMVSGFHARVVQHECDHLDGVMYPMRIADISKFGFTEELFPGRHDSAG